jgi:hypothetical protein
MVDKRLTGTIFQNKELAGRWDFAIADTSSLLPLRTVPLCAPCIHGQGLFVTTNGFFLWRVVEKDCGEGKGDRREASSNKKW